MKPILTALLFVLILIVPARAQSPAALDAAAKRAAVQQAAAAMREGYVFPDQGDAAARRLEAQLAAGAYEALVEPRAFAEALTNDLRAVTKDKHVGVRALGAPPAPPLGPAPPRSQGGVVRADRLAEGIGYIEIVGFPPPAAFRPALDPALAALEGSRALIIDIRRNGGGSPDGVAYLVSHFLASPEPVVINAFHSRKRGTREFTVRESMSVPTPRSFAGKPLYVLTSGRTFSGGEEFAYDVQAFKLGTLVGETTGGGANPGGVRPITPLFSMFVPDGRPINPVTKTNWEGVGVVPDVRAPADQALKVALERLGHPASSADIAQVSTAQLFRFRSEPNPQSEAAVRRLADGLARGAPPYEQMNPRFAEMVRDDLERTRERFASLGALESVTFNAVDPMGFDRYDLRFERGAMDMRIVIGDGGIIEGAAFGPAAAAPPSEAARQAAFRANDPDGDGKLAKADYRRLLEQLGFADQLETLFAQRDVDRDGFVSAEEFRTPIPQ
jgi:hypothetical protein